MAGKSAEASKKIESACYELIPALQENDGNTEKSCPTDKVSGNRKWYKLNEKHPSSADRDVESGIGLGSSSETSLDSSESFHRSGEFRKRYLASSTSIVSTDLSEYAEELQTDVRPPPVQPLSRYDDLIKGRVDDDYDDTREDDDIEDEPKSSGPFVVDQDPPPPPRQPEGRDGCNRATRRQEKKEPEGERNETRPRPIQVRPPREEKILSSTYAIFVLLFTLGYLAVIGSTMYLSQKEVDDKMIVLSVALIVFMIFVGLCYCSRCKRQ